MQRYPGDLSPVAMGKRLFSFAVITDTHCTETDDVSTSPWPSNALANGRAAAAYRAIRASKPDFVLHLGDMIHPVPAQPSYVPAAKRHAEIAAAAGCPVYLTPGNHDVGDKPVEWAPVGRIRPDYITQYEAVFGPSYHAFTANDCHFIVVNASLINSGLQAEETQRGWLEDVLATNKGRTFVSIHYPPYVLSEHEPSSYDNIDQPGRDWLLGLLKKYKPEAVFSGHVHNFWYDRYDETDLYILPATSFVRQDYSEMYRIDGGAENGRDDVDKLGFAMVDVHEHGHVVSFQRGLTSPPGDTTAPRLHSATNSLPSLGIDLRHPWADIIDIPANGGVDEFSRKKARNDYPLLAIWEMGIRHLRVPLQDFTEAATRHRIALMTRLGARFSPFSFGLPSGDDLDCLVVHEELIDALEVILPWPMDDQTYRNLSALRGRLKTRIILSTQRRDHASVNGHYVHAIRHGFVADELPAFDQNFGTRDVNVVDGVMLRVGRDFDPTAQILKAAEWSRRSGLRVRVMVRIAGENPAGRETDDHTNASRVAGAAFAGLLTPDVDVFFDTFDDVDRGYFATNGLVDRRYNPRMAARILRNLQTSLITMGVSERSIVSVTGHESSLRILGHAGETSFILAQPGEVPSRIDRVGQASTIQSCMDLVSGQQVDHRLQLERPSLVIFD